MHSLVTTTVDDVEVALRLARGVVAARLGACAQVVGPVTSVYRWEGEVREDQEWQVQVKTTAERVAALTEHLLAAHPYDVPEVVATPITGGSAAYLGWVTTETA
ncbi:MAG TPA: divalent-cation tolerance protein CutA [Pseudonocardiaceae bacterium]